MPLHEVFSAALASAKAAGRPGLSDGSLAAARSAVDDGAKLLGPGPQVASVEDRAIPSRSGSVPARLYRPAQETPALVVYFHGGGWVSGSLDGFDALARSLAHRCGCTVLSVDYRLAPEHPFPAGILDAQDALRWASANLADLAGAGAKLIVAGDSAGANLATVAALVLRRELEIALQVLFYPVTGANFDTSSYVEHSTGLSLTRADMMWFFSHYAPESLWNDPRIAPLGTDLTGAPPAWVGMAQYDVLRSEGEAYAARLAAAGVRTESKTYAGLTHGFARWFNLVAPAGEALDDAARAIRAAVRA